MFRDTGLMLPRDEPEYWRFIALSRLRVIEEVAIECESDWENCKTVEISLNWIAICDKTNAVNYFGEDSRACDLVDGRGGFLPGSKTHCADFDPADTGGSWRAGEANARPGILMPGTALLGARYFQEVAPNLDEPEESAIDRGHIVAMGLEFGDDEEDIGLRTDCIQAIDTNPADGECCDEFYNPEAGDDWEDECDVKTYCPGIGIVKDQDLELTSYGFVGDDDDDDDDHKRWRRRHHRSWH